MSELRAVIRIQWKASWHVVLALSVAALALPVVSVRSGWKGDPANLPLFLTELQLWGFFYPTLAAIAAIAVAVSVWRSDRRGHHIYALLLPLPRWKYVLLRYAGGLVMLAPIVVALWAGALIATTALDLPPGLRTFPHELAVKFALSLLLLFGLTFAAASASNRALGVGFRLLGLLIAVHIGVLLLRPGTHLLWKVVTALATYPGPFSPMGGRWMLIDV
jgi:ABC-type transport system involved in multi-copper enzyme maturation permease subunit